MTEHAQTAAISESSAGAIEYVTEAITLVDDFFDNTEVEYDDYKQFAVKQSPSNFITMDGSEVCRGDLPPTFSFLFKVKIDSPRFAVTLFKIEGQLSIILDACNHQILVDYHRSSCTFQNRTLTLRQEVTPDRWYKIGLAFSDDVIQLYVDCILTDWNSFETCRTECNEDTPVSLLTPSNLPHCSSQEGKVRDQVII